MSGEFRFVMYSTSGRGSIPRLPEDVRWLIYEATFPRVFKRCSRCAAVVAVESICGSVFLIRACARIELELCCAACVLPAESLVGQVPRPCVRRWRETRARLVCGAD